MQRTAIVLTTAAFIVSTAAGAEVRQKYDKFAGIFTVSSPSPPPQVAPQLFVIATFRSYDFANLPYKPKITLKLVTTGPDWRFFKCSSLYWLVDGKRLKLPQPAHDGTIGEGYVIEYIVVTVPTIELLQQLSTANRVEYRLCRGVYELSAAELKDIRDLYKQLTTPRVAEQTQEE